MLSFVQRDTLASPNGLQNAESILHLPAPGFNIIQQKKATKGRKGRGLLQELTSTSRVWRELILILLFLDAFIFNQTLTARYRRTSNVCDMFDLVASVGQIVRLVFQAREQL